MQHVLDADVRIPGELPRPVLRSPPPGTFAIYASPRNEAAKEVAELMLAEEVAGRTSGSAAALTITTDPAEAHLAQYFLLYLNDVVHDDAPGLCAELEVALRDKRRVLSVHEQRNGRGAVPFGQIIKRTPPALLSLGVYKEVSEATARTRSNFALVAHACPVGSRPHCATARRAALRWCRSSACLPPLHACAPLRWNGRHGRVQWVAPPVGVRAPSSRGARPTAS